MTDQSMHDEYDEHDVTGDDVADAPTNTRDVDMTQELVKVAAYYTPRAFAAIQGIAAETGDTLTDTINRAAQAYQLLLELQRAGNGRVRVLNADGTADDITIY